MEEIVFLPRVGGEVEHVVEGGPFSLLDVWGRDELTYVTQDGDSFGIVCYGSQGRIHFGLGYLFCSFPPFGDRSSPKKIQ